MRRTIALLTIITLAGGVASCGSSSPTTSRNEADWAEAQRQAGAIVAPEISLLGVTTARSREQEIAKELYNAAVAREQATPEEKAKLKEGEAGEAPAEGG